MVSYNSPLRYPMCSNKHFLWMWRGLIQPSGDQNEFETYSRQQDCTTKACSYCTAWPLCRQPLGESLNFQQDIIDHKLFRDNSLCPRSKCCFQLKQMWSCTSSLPNVFRRPTLLFHCEVWGAGRNSSLLRCDALGLGEQFLAFRRIAVLPCSWSISRRRTKTKELPSFETSVNTLPATLSHFRRAETSSFLIK
jgi:hypothetical protein